MTQSFGPTGEFPQGKSSPDDEGEIVMGMAIQGGIIILHFGARISWIGLDAITARSIAAGLLAKADELEGTQA